MSNRSIEQALANLLPAQADALPPDLVKLASSLYAQSRNYGSTLKPDEEIARPHACAEIACKRLSRSLKLPELMSRPPCPPRVYSKVYNYLEQALAKASVRRKASTTSSVPSFAQNTPRKPAIATHTYASPSPTKQQTPTKAPTTPSALRTAKQPAQATPSRPRTTPLKRKAVSNQRRKKNHVSEDAPAWTMSVIRNVCKVQPGDKADDSEQIASRERSITSFLAPHIYTGLSCILAFIREAEASRKVKRGKKTEDELADEEFMAPVVHWQSNHEEPNATYDDEAATGRTDEDISFRNRLTSLIVALYLVIYSRYLAQTAKNASIDMDTYIEMSRCALTVVGLSDPTYLDDVDIWLSKIMTQGWTKGKEWFDNIPLEEHGEEAGGKRRKVEKKKVSDIEEEQRGGLLPGLATMMQDKLDFLSEERRERYRVWSQNMLSRINEMEAGAAYN